MEEEGGGSREGYETCKDETNSRLPPQRHLRRLGQILVHRRNLFGDVGKGAVEEIEALVLDVLKVVARALGLATGPVELLLRRPELVFDALEPFHRARVGRHLVELGGQRRDAFLELRVELVVAGILIVGGIRVLVVSFWPLWN